MKVLKLRAILIIVISLQCSNLFAQHINVKELLHKTYAQRYGQLDTLFYGSNFWHLDSSTAFSRIEELAALAKKEGDEELFLENTIIAISYKRHSGRHNVQHYIATLKNLLEIAIDKKLIQLQIRCCYLLSNEFYVNDKFGEMFEYQLQFYNLLKHPQAKDFPFTKWCIASIGSSYYSFQDYEMALRYYWEANVLPSSYRDFETVDVNNSLGLVHRQLGHYDSAHFYFDKALNEAERVQQKDWVHIVKGNIGITYYLQKNYAIAVPLLREDIAGSLRIKDYENASNSIIKLADIFEQTNKKDSAWLLCQQVRGLIAAGTWHPYRHLLPLYKLMGKLALQKGNTTLSYSYMDSAFVAQDSLANRRKLLLLEHARHKVEVKKHESEIAEKKLDIQSRNFTIIVLVLTMFIAMLLINRQTIRRKRLLAEKKFSDTNLENAQSRLAAFTKTLHEKNVLLEKAAEEISRLQQVDSPQDAGTVSNQVVEDLYSSTILTDEEWEDFKELFEQVHAGFLVRLKEKLPELSPAEIRFMALTKLKLDNKEMANALGIGASGMRNYRYRLRKKLNIAEEDGLEKLVETI